MFATPRLQVFHLQKSNKLIKCPTFKAAFHKGLPCKGKNVSFGFIARGH